MVNATNREKLEGVPDADLAGAIHRLALAQLVDKALPEAPSAMRRPAEERLWVQFNRVFGLKVACRWIACASAGAKTWPDMSACADSMVLDVAELGSALERADATAGRKRDELLATGLPRRRNMASMDRFVSQTIARVTRAGTVYPGAVLQYSLATLEGGRLALTDRGCFFAQFANPVLDAELKTAAATLSRHEQRFLLEQVAEYVPGELTDFRAVLSAIREGKVTPEEVVEVVRQGLPSDWSDQVARTHVAGLIGRMTELGLLRRHWTGRRVRYEGVVADGGLM
jgi:hypothetical protein